MKMDFSDDDLDSITDIEESIGKYEGETNNLNQRHGKGKATLPNNDTYEGEYQNGKRHGQGTYTFVSSGARYVGSYEHGKKDGFGEFTFPDGSRYEGYFSQDLRYGHGVFHYANKDKYDGEWADNKKHGFGKYTFANGSEYEGQWQHGQWHGCGEFVNASHRFVGMYENGRPVGEGRYVFAKGGYEQTGCWVKKIGGVGGGRKDSFGDFEASGEEEEEKEEKLVWRPWKLMPIKVGN